LVEIRTFEIFGSPPFERITVLIKGIGVEWIPLTACSIFFKFIALVPIVFAQPSRGCEDNENKSEDLVYGMTEHISPHDFSDDSVILLVGLSR